MNLLFVALGGFIGSIVRYNISISMNKRLIGTWIANISGSILLAILFHFYQSGSLTPLLWSFLGIGFCGAYTTFSTFGNETLQLMLDKKYLRAFGYVTSSMAVSLLFVGLVLALLS